MLARPLPRIVRNGLLAAWALAALALSESARAFVVNPYQSGDETLYLKWGDNHAGTAGGVVYWSFIPAGTPGSAYCADACPATSVDSIELEISPGGGFVSTPLAALEPRIRAAMARWAERTGIRFIKLDTDSGAAINDAGALPPATGHVRIGAFVFGGTAGGAAVGYSPPPNGGTGAGDILLNAAAYFQLAPGLEGDPYDTTFAPNDFEGLLVHELGHAIGLGHPAFDGSCPVMCIDPRFLGVIRRLLATDDSRGASFLYDTLFVEGYDPP